MTALCQNRKDVAAGCKTRAKSCKKAFPIVKSKNLMSDTSRSDLLRLCTLIVSAHISWNRTTPEDVHQVIHLVYAALKSAGAPPADARRKPAVLLKKSVFPRLHRLPGGRQKVEAAEAASSNRLRADAAGVPGEMGPAGDLSDGGTELRCPPLDAGEGIRLGAQSRYAIIDAAHAAATAPRARSEKVSVTQVRRRLTRFPRPDTESQTAGRDLPDRRTQEAPPAAGVLGVHQVPGARAGGNIGLEMRSEVRPDT